MEANHLLYIDGTRRAPRNEATFLTYDPATGESMATISEAGVDDVELAVGAARCGSGMDFRYQKGARMSRALRARVVWVNDSQPAPTESMWGGFKQSGVGRELGPWGIEGYLEEKQIYLKL